ncbi:hypothetical protein Tco_0141058 [Tanacetum coccineum]
MSRVATLVEDVYWVVMLCSALCPESLGRQAQLVNTDTESDPKEAPSKAEEFQSLASSNSTTSLSHDHPLTHASPTPTPT